MKRAFLRKVKSVSCSSCESHALVGESEQTVSGVRRKARTSAAMVGLALSMGATSLLIPRQNDGAAAAESKTPEVSPSSVSRMAALPSESSVELPTVSPSELEITKYTVRDGQTLQQIADLYQITLESLAAANSLVSTASLRAGQILRIPVSAEPITIGVAQSPQVLALADINRLPAPSDASNRSPDQLQGERNQALNRLRQERSKLKETLAELRREELRGVGAASSRVGSSTAEGAETGTKSLVEQSAVSETMVQSQSVAELPRLASADTFPSIATLPSPTASPAAPSIIASPSLELDWMQANQSLVIPNPESRLVPQRTEQVEIPTANSLAGPNRVAARSETLTPNSSPLNTAPVIDAVPEEVSYQVSPGDTIARIARAHNIPQSALIAANRLNDPNVIFVGQTLRLPGDAPTQARTIPSVLPAENAVSQPSSGVTAVLPTAQPSVGAVRSVAVAPSSLLPPEATTQPSSLEQPNLSNVGGRNPYVQNLLSEIRTMQGRRSQQQADNSPPISVAAVSSSEAENLGGAESLRNPVVSESRSANVRRPEAVRTAPRQATPRQTTPTVVAAAPLGSESYEPLLQPITGRMVSPDLPALPDADRFLPNGSIRGYTWPARGVLSSGYGWRWGRMHHGIDIAADVGTPIYAAAGGVVEYAGWNSGGYGNMIEVRHSDGSMTRYAHLNAVYVQVGQRVGQSEQIGEMGSTGYSTGPHLHFEVHLADQGTVNPMAYLPAE